MRVLLSILGVGLLAGACSTAAATPAQQPTASPNPTPEVKYHVETGAGSLILRISSEGGFVGPGALLTRLPEWTLYGDGRILVPGIAPLPDPAPLLPVVTEMKVTPAEIQKILAAADDAGILGADADYTVLGNPDAGTTVFRVNVGGRTHIIRANSLGGAQGPGGGPGTGDGSDPAVSAARARLADFEAKTQDMSTFLGRTVDQTAVYAPTSVRLYVSPASVDQSNPAPKLVWPLSSDPASGKTGLAEGVGCLAVTGTDLATFLDAARAATPATIWTAASGDYSVQVRPLYPDESGC